MITPDPRCRYGCDKSMTNPTSTTFITTEPITGQTDQPEMFQEDQKRYHKNKNLDFRRSLQPVMKHVPRVHDKLLSLITENKTRNTTKL